MEKSAPYSLNVAARTSLGERPTGGYAQGQTIRGTAANFSGVVPSSSYSAGRFATIRAIRSSPFAKQFPGATGVVRGAFVGRSGRRGRDARSASTYAERVKLSERDALDRFLNAPVARLATVSAECEPHIVPVTFVIHDRIITIAVDHKPKLTTDLRRIRNIRQTRRAAVLVDHYDDDWAKLWWVRIDGSAEVVERLDAAELELLRKKYRQYREVPPVGPAIRVAIGVVRGWSYT
jgi:PPOX class probable F420-dependent enzyme